VPRLDRDGVGLAYDEMGAGDPPLLFVHGLACNRGFWPSQLSHFSAHHRVIAIDLRGHGGSDAPPQRYTMQGFADDLAWMSDRLGAERPVLVGHSLGGLVAIELAAAAPKRLRAAVLIDSVLLPPGDRAGAVHRLVAGLRGPDPAGTLGGYYGTFFQPYSDPQLVSSVLEQVVRTAPHVTSSVFEEALTNWSDAQALERSGAPLLYVDAGTPNADLAHAVRLKPGLMLARTIGSGHFSPLEVPDQVNAAIERFLEIAL
jgi:pimeloyl-ACP methyl ester carboxylesterase